MPESVCMRDNPSFFAILPADVRYDPELTPLEKILYAEISALTNERGYCWAGNQYFARLYGRHEHSISRSINKLEGRGYINIETEKGGKKAGSERVISLPKKYMIPPHPTSQKCEPAQSKPLATSQKCEPVTLYSINNIKKKNCSFLQNEPLLHFNEIWGKYPLKSSKKEAFRYFKASVKNERDWKNIQTALENYLLHLAHPNNTWKQPQAGKTWFNNWHDWVDWQEPETAEDMQARHKKLDGLISRAADISKSAFMEIAEDEFEHVKAELIKQRENAMQDYKKLCEELKGIWHNDYKPEIIEKILRRAADVDTGD